MTQASSVEVKQADTIAIIVDSEVAAYIEQQKIQDVSAYVNRLLQEERGRQQKEGRPGSRPEGAAQDNAAVYTPDTSGYPEVKPRFSSASEPR